MKDTIHIPGIELGFKRPVLFERHAVGGEYGAGWKKAGASFKASARHESKAFARSDLRKMNCLKRSRICPLSLFPEQGYVLALKIASGFCRLARGGCSPLSSLKAWTRQRKSSPGIRCPVGPLCISPCMGGTS